MKKWFLRVLCLFVIFAGVIDTPLPSSAAQQRIFSFATGASGGAFYAVGAGMSALVSERAEGVAVTAETSGGSNENINLVGLKEADFGFAAADIVYQGYTGTETFSRSYPNLRHVMSTFGNTHQVVVLADSDIQTVSDLKGKNISVGPEGAITALPNFLRAAAGLEMGVDYQGQYLSHSQAAEALGDGKIDAITVGVGFPTSAFMELAVTKPIRLIPLNESEINALVNNPNPNVGPYVPIVIPAGTYNGQNEDIPTVTIPVLIVAHEDVDKEAVYQFTKTVLEGLDYLIAINASASEISKERAMGGQVTPMHPGAERYYKEIGLIP